MRTKPPSSLALLGAALAILMVVDVSAQQPPTPSPVEEDRDAAARDLDRPADRRPPAAGSRDAAAPPPSSERSAVSEMPRTNPFAFAFGRQVGRRQRLVRIPDMFGDFFTGGQMTADSGPDMVTSDLPLAGGSRRAKAAEHNKAFVEDRVYVTYHHFNNALEVDTVAGIVPEQSSHVDRYLVAFEKTLGECSSIEVRAPFTTGFDYTDPAFRVAGGEIGDLAFLCKRVLYECECAAASAGLAITVPTGSDVRGSFPLLGTTFEVANQAVHLAPFLAYSRTADRSFFHAFAQLDVAANGNRIAVNDTMLGVAALGRLNEQSLLYLDLSAGYWLHEDPCARGVTGVAGLVELHYTTTLQDADVVAFPALTPAPSFGGVDNRFDVPNLTVGLHIEMEADTAIRAAGVFPLASAPDDRFFSSEVQVAVIRRF